MIGRTEVARIGRRCVAVGPSAKHLSTSARKDKSYKLVVVGGGTGGCATAAKFSSILGAGKVAVIEPAETHYYQPLWTLVGGGLKKLEESGRAMKQVLPSKADWIRERAVSFSPESNRVTTESGDQISYDFLVIAMGFTLRYEQIKGLPEAFETPGVGSNYSPLYVEKTHKALKDFKGGNALFTFPNCPIKCAGAPQKIMYIFEDFHKKNGRKDKMNITFNTGLPVIFVSKYYADVLWDLAKRRGGISINVRHNLVEVKPDAKEAVFQNLDKPEEFKTFPYDFLHVTPPMSPPDALRNEPKLVDAAGFLDLDKGTLQHQTYGNIFGIGDCTSLPTSKTAAAVAGEFGILKRNLSSAMEGKPLTAVYNGYTSCPIVTSSSTCIMAEFDYATNPIETFPFDQRKERRTMFHVKRDALPFMYWNAMLKGRWSGPQPFRKLFHFGMKASEPEPEPEPRDRSQGVFKGAGDGAGGLEKWEPEPEPEPEPRT